MRAVICYAVQYAKILGAGARVIAFARNPEKLAIAREYGADDIVDIKGKPAADIGRELHQLVGRNDIDAAMDCAGAPEMVQLAMSLLSIGGHYADVGLVGDRIDLPLFPRVSREQTLHGSFWGNNTDLGEVMALAAQDKIRHTVKTFGFEELNDYINRLRVGDVVGRAVMKF
ncbi:zinc-binding dehydrogenase [Caballeronia sp. LZ033]|uniref:zinc-binding dehydrogenase n=1 Tax=Caballeronia sp. LZ033 TaxID=3038566 RepID=UPI00285DDEA8|nr:zinc-binding dehydrogenase [Caballeronia sp. LZ033]MDR5816947.1 zinc-binding dehydrogenase [Caballeronia sp. LZ033]